MSYATPAQFREIVHEAEDGSESESLYAGLIERASRAFDRLCGVADGYFDVAAETATAKVIYSDGTGFLKLPPYVGGSISSLTVPSSYSTPTYVEQGGYLVVTSGGIVTGQVNGWWAGVAITVTARWGFAETPADVVQAVLEWAIKMWRFSDPALAKTVALENQSTISDAPAYTKVIADRWRMKGKVAFA